MRRPSLKNGLEWTTPRSRRAVTLFELLIAIAIILAMLAIIAPNLLGQLEQRRFDSTNDVLLQQLLLARAHAQATGNTVEVRYIPSAENDSARIESRLLIQDPLERWPEDGAVDSAAVRRDAESESDDVSDDQSRIYESWARLELPGRYRITDVEPEFDDRFSLAAGVGVASLELGDSGATALQSRAAEQVVRLAVFLPDGSTLAGEPLWLVDDAQRVAKIIINSWTGLASIEPVEATDDENDEQPIETLRDEP